MDARRPDDLPSDLTAVLEWWREAGVDCAFDDAPRQWIVAPDPQDEAAAPVDSNSFPAVKAATAAPPPLLRTMIGGDHAHWPTELSAFTPWWLAEPSLDSGQVRGRVPPRGAFAAPLMILVPEPEAEDHDTLLSGPQGRLLAAMLAAMGLANDQVYIASALPRHTPMVDWRDLAEQGLGEILQWHVALARPQRLVAFGRHILPLLSPAGLESPLAYNTPTQIIPILPTINHEGASVPVLVACDLGALLERPIAKGHFWQHWLEWSAG